MEFAGAVDVGLAFLSEDNFVQYCTHVARRKLAQVGCFVTLFIILLLLQAGHSLDDFE